MQGKILTIQNIECEHLGIFKPLLEHDGFSIDTVIASKEKLPDSLHGYNALIVLGGPMSANDPYDHLREEERLILQVVNSGVPMLGICLGSQLLAKVINGRVYKGHVKEIGWYTVNLTEHALRTVFRGLDDRLLVFQWHNDTYDLPDIPNISRLAYSSNYSNQAFIVNNNAIGLQFHVEVDEHMIQDWLEEYSYELDSSMKDAIMNEVKYKQSMLEHTARVVYRNFSNMISLYKYKDNLP